MLRLRDEHAVPHDAQRSIDERWTPLRSHRAGRRRGPRRQGAVLVLVTLLLIAFFAATAFSVDVARMHLANAELRAATDAAAKAAVTNLATTQDLTAARQAATQVAAANFVAGKPLVLESQDIVFGAAQTQADGSLSFVAGATPYGAVQIHSRKLSGSASGNVPLLFGGVLGKPSFDTQLTATAARLDRDVALVLDRSGSMQGQKIADLKSAVAVFLSTVADPNQTQLVGLGSYSTTATLDQPLTSNLSTIQTKVNSMVAAGWTDIGAGINTGRTILAGGHNRQFCEKIMILMTDGIHNQQTSPEGAAANAKLENIVIHTLTFGADADQARMRAIAATTGGTFHHAPDGATLSAAFQDIAKTIRSALIQ
jgi:Ca-activated chloride channel family protein